MEFASLFDVSNFFFLNFKELANLTYKENTKTFHNYQVGTETLQDNQATVRLYNFNLPREGA